MILNNLQQGQLVLNNKEVVEAYIGNKKVFPMYDDIIFLDWVKFTDISWYWGDTTSVEGQEPMLLHTDTYFIRPDIRPKTLDIKVSMSVDMFGIADTTFFGTRSNYNTGEYRVGIGGGYGGQVDTLDFNSYCTDKSSFNSYQGSGYQYNRKNPYYTTHGFHTIETNSNKLYLDGSLYITCGRSGYWEQVRPWCPFGGCRTIKETSMWIEGNLVYHYVPVKKGNKYGLYDLISSHFFGKETYLGGYDNNIVW